MRRNVLRTEFPAAAGAIGLLIVLCVSPALAQERMGRPRPERREPANVEQKENTPRPERPAPSLAPAVRLEATVFHVEIARERIVDLDAKSLAAEGTTPAKLAQALEKIGLTEVRFRVDQPFAADHDKHEVADLARDVPYATATATTSGGTVQAAIARERVGCKLVVQGSFPDEAQPQLLQAIVTIETASLSGSNVDAGGGVTVPVFWRMRQNYTGATELGKPVILVSVDAGTSSTNDRIVAMVSIITLSAAGK